MHIKLKTFFLRSYWFLIGIILSFLLLLICFASLQEVDISSMFSSDALYLPSVYQDIFVNGNSLKGWSFNPAPNFIPDMLLFFILMAITQNFIVATFLFSIIQYFVIIFLFYAIFKAVVKIDANIFSLSLYLFSFILLFFLTTGSFPLAFIFISNSYHNGMFVMTLICLLLGIKFLQTNSWKYLIWVFALSSISYPCDKLFLTSFILPSILTCAVLLFTLYNKKNVIKLIAACTIGMLLGILILYVFKHNDIFTIYHHHGSRKIEHIIYSWNIFYGQIRGYITELSIKSVMVVISMLTYLCTMYYTIRTYISIVQKKEKVTPIFLFELFVFFYTPIVFLTPIINGHYALHCIRYNYFPFILLPFNLVLLISPYLKKAKYSSSILNSICSISFVIFLIWTLNQRDIKIKVGLKNYFNAYPQSAQLLDSLFEDNGIIHYGITNDYWFAKQATMFSKKNIRLYFINDDGKPWLHVSNKNWFTGGGEGKYSNPQFTFLLWNSDRELPTFFKSELPPYEKIEVKENMTLYEVCPFIFEEKSLKPVLIKK